MVRKFMGCRMHSSDYLRFLARRRLVVLRGGMCDINVHKIINCNPRESTLRDDRGEHLAKKEGTHFEQTAGKPCNL